MRRRLLPLLLLALAALAVVRAGDVALAVRAQAGGRTLLGHGSITAHGFRAGVSIGPDIPLADGPLS
jgi:hypothetical protein